MLDILLPAFLIISQSNQLVDSPVHTAINSKRERLVALAAGGHAKQYLGSSLGKINSLVAGEHTKQYLGSDLTSEQIDTMADEQIE